MRQGFRMSLAAVACLLASTGAVADTFVFGELISGGGPESSSFSTLEITGQDTTSWTFNLVLDDSMADIFGANSFVGTMAADFLGDVKNATISNVTGSGDWTPAVSIKNGGAPGGGWDFRFDYTTGGKNGKNFSAGDTVSWTVDFDSTGEIPALTDRAFALHIQSTRFDNNSAWYAPGPIATAVPEPSAYAMMGIGLLAVVACVRRRRA